MKSLKGLSRSRPDVVSEEARQRIDLALAVNTANQIDRTTAPQIVGIALIVALFEPRLESDAIWWWALASLVNVARGALFNQFHKRSLRRGVAHSWGGFLNTVFSLGFGALWGSLVIIADRYGTVEDYALAVVIALGVMSLSGVVSAGSRSMYLTGVVGNVLTIGVAWSMSGRLTWAFAFLLLVYFVAAAYLHDTVHRTLRTNTESMYRNEVLATQLESMLAFQDPMTQLRNRDGLLAWFEEANSSEHGRRVVVAVGNVERLSSINELFGATHGDHVLMAIGRRLLALASPTVVACRLAGDEFAVVEVVNDGSSVSPDLVEQRLLDAVRDSIEVDGEWLDVSMSTAVEVGALADFERLLVAASAVVRSERARRAPSLSASHGPLAERRILIDDLRVALSDGSMTAWFQPIVDCERGDIIAWEALARWTHPVRGLISPGEFLGLVELGQLDDPFTNLIIEDSVRFISELLVTKRGRSASVHVNLTAAQAGRSDIVDTILATLARYDVPSKCLVVEITEQEVPHLDDRLVGNLARLEAAEVGISIDDFGTGYSSLSHLFDIRPTELKIDKTFVDGLPHDPTSVGLVCGVLGLAKGMGLATVAEGVESREQADFLQAQGCDSFQGYLASPALPSADALELFDRNAAVMSAAE